MGIGGNIELFGMDEIKEHIVLDLFSLFIIEKGCCNILESIVSPRRLTGGAIGICLKGSGEVMIDSKIYQVNERDMFVIFPQTIFQPISFSDDIKFFVFGISPDFFATFEIGSLISYFVYIKEHPCMALAETDVTNIMELCELVHQKSTRTGKSFMREIAEKLILALCYEICAIYSHKKPIEQSTGKRKDVLLADFLYLLAIHYKDSREPEFYASRLFVTPKYLYQVVKEKSGQTPSAWIAFTVIVNAKGLLKNNTMSIAQISDQLNFPNPSFFTQYFKKHTGLTPGMFRNQN